MHFTNRYDIRFMRESFVINLHVYTTNAGEDISSSTRCRLKYAEVLFIYLFIFFFFCYFRKLLDL